MAARSTTAWDRASPRSYNVFRNNRIHDLTQPYLNGTQNTHVGIAMYVGPGQTAYNNVIFNVSGYGILLNYGTTNGQVLNNTFHQISGVGQAIYLGTSANGTVVKNNIIWGNAGPAIVDESPSAVVSNNLCAGDGGCDVSSDPLFVDAGAGDFHLRAQSPAIDVGADLSEYGVELDFDGNRRPQGCCFDLGAHEFPVNVPPAAKARSFIGWSCGCSSGLDGLSALAFIALLTTRRRHR
jgi:hypothetical protein